MENFIKLLAEFVSIKSVSADPTYKAEVTKAVNWLVQFASKSGLQTKVVKGYDNPIVLAKTKRDLSLKTILIYGHYDVQPAQKEDGWSNDPFVLSEKSGKLYGRGAADNKGQILMHLYSIGKLIKENKLNSNIIFFIEGNEETGSPNLRRFIEKYKKELACDCVLISDGDLNKNLAPALEASFRGVANVEIILETAKDDSHSGLFGGKIPNAAEELSVLLSKMHGPNRKVLVPGFYAGLQKIGQDPVGLEPATEITSLVSGYLGEGFRNSIPARAQAKINIRSAPNQNPKVLVRKLKDFVFKNKPEFAKIIFKAKETTRGAVLDLTNDFAKKSLEILKDVYGKKPIAKNSGGTLPIVNDFKEVLGVPQVMIPLANFDCGMHSASENIEIAAVKKGLEFSSRFFSK